MKIFGFLAALFFALSPGAFATGVCVGSLVSEPNHPYWLAPGTQRNFVGVVIRTEFGQNFLFTADFYLKDHYQLLQYVSETLHGQNFSIVWGGELVLQNSTALPRIGKWSYALNISGHIQDFIMGQRRKLPARDQLLTVSNSASALEALLPMRDRADGFQSEEFRSENSIQRSTPHVDQKIANRHRIGGVFAQLGLTLATMPKTIETRRAPSKPDFVTMVDHLLTQFCLRPDSHPRMKEMVPKIVRALNEGYLPPEVKKEYEALFLPLEANPQFHSVALP